MIGTTSIKHQTAEDAKARRGNPVSILLCMPAAPSAVWLTVLICLSFSFLSLQQLIGEHADQNHRAHHREIERPRTAQQVDEVLQALQQRGAEQNADD